MSASLADKAAAVRSRSWIDAASNNFGTVIAIKAICRDRTEISEVGIANGPRPCFAFQVEMTTRTTEARLVVPGPNRTAVHTSKGRGAYRSQIRGATSSDQSLPNRNATP